MLEPDEIPKMAGDQALFALSSGILLMMGGVREALDERKLNAPQIKRLYNSIWFILPWGRAPRS